MNDSGGLHIRINMLINKRMYDEIRELMYDTNCSNMSDVIRRAINDAIVNNKIRKTKIGENNGEQR